MGTEASQAKTCSTTKRKAENKAKTKSSPESKASSDSSHATNSLFASAISSGSNRENLGVVHVIKKVASSKGRASNAPRTSRGHQKPTVGGFAELTDRLQTELGKDNGVVVSCTYLAQDGKATYDEDSQEWYHILQLRSALPFRLIKSNVITTGMYQNHIALLIRQETPFRLLSLPLNIRTKIYAFALKHHEPAISIIPRKNTRTIWAPTYHTPHTLSLLRTSKTIHTEAAPIVYAQPFIFPGTQVICDFLLRIARNRRFLRSLSSETYTAKSARAMFALVSEARGLECLRFEHVSSKETPVKAVKNIWTDGGAWLAGIDRKNPTKGLDILKFDAKAFHMREKDKDAGGYRVTCWGPAEQLEFLKGLRAEMVAEGTMSDEAAEGKGLTMTAKGKKTTKVAEGKKTSMNAGGKKPAKFAGSKKPKTLAQVKKPKKAD